MTHSSPSTHLDLYFPRLGQCLLCGVPGEDQRHRVVDAIRGRVCAGDSEDMVALDYGVSVAAVRVAATTLEPTDD